MTTLVLTSPCSTTKYGFAAHAVERLEDHFLVLSEEREQVSPGTGDDIRGRALGEPGRVRLLINIPEARRAVNDEQATFLGKLKNVGGKDELHVEGRILSHQHGVEIFEVRLPGLAEDEPRS